MEWVKKFEIDSSIFLFYSFFLALGHSRRGLVGQAAAVFLSFRINRTSRTFISLPPEKGQGVIEAGTSSRISPITHIRGEQTPTLTYQSSDKRCETQRSTVS